MQVVIIFIIAAAVIWLLWKHIKEIAADDLERSYMNRASKKKIEDREDYDGKLK